MFIAASNEIIPPMTTMPDMALETLINGECNDGVMPHITKYPIKADKTKIMNKYMVSILTSLSDIFPVFT